MSLDKTRGSFPGSTGAEFARTVQSMNLNFLTSLVLPDNFRHFVWRLSCRVDDKDHFIENITSPE